MNFPISSDSNQSKSEEEKKNSTFKNNSFSIEGGNQPLQQALQPELQIFEQLTFLKMMRGNRQLVLLFSMSANENQHTNQSLSSYAKFGEDIKEICTMDGNMMPLETNYNFVERLGVGA